MMKQYGNDSFYATILDAMMDLVRVVDREGNVVLANQSLKNSFGDCVGRKCYECWGETEKCKNCVVDQAKFESGVACATAERTFHGRHYSVNATPLNDKDGKLMGTVEVFRDITDMVRIRERLLKINGKMMQDISMARRLQRSMMEKDMPNVPGYVFYDGFYPCEAIGGDAYDCILLNDGRILLYVADVSGHGVRAAMLTIFLMQEIQLLSRLENVSVAYLLRDLDRAFQAVGAEESAYITIFMAIIDSKTGRMDWCNAGHSVAPILKTSEGVQELYMSGLPVSRWFDAPEREVRQTVLAPGDRILFYTDGILSVHSLQQSEQELKESFASDHYEAKEFIAKMRRRHMKNVHDDFAMLICERL